MRTEAKWKCNFFDNIFLYWCNKWYTSSQYPELCIEMRDMRDRSLYFRKNLWQSGYMPSWFMGLYRKSTLQGHKKKWIKRKTRYRISTNGVHPDSKNLGKPKTQFMRGIDSTQHARFPNASSINSHAHHDTRIPCCANAGSVIGVLLWSERRCCDKSTFYLWCLC